jgi:hypothetical protein
MNPLEIISSLLLFTNSISCTATNFSGVETVTNKDEIQEATIYSLTTRAPVRDADGNVISTITNTGVYTLVSPTGWGYQRQLTVPIENSNFVSYLPGSLAYNMVTNLQARTNGFSNPSVAESRFSTANWTTTNFIPNPGFWFSFAPQLTATVVAMGSVGSNNMVGQIGGSAITPRHVLNCAHAPYGINTFLIFVDDNGSNVGRTVIGSIGVPNSDINVVLLDSDLPSTVHPFALLPPAWTNSFSNLAGNLPIVIGQPLPLGSPGIQLVGYNQAQQVFPKLGTNFSYGETAEFWAVPDASWLGADWDYTVYSGDSGHPVMLLMGTNLVLFSHWYGIGSGDTAVGDIYAQFEPAIQSAMHWLSTNYNVGSDYQISTVDLSAFPTY